MEQNIQKVKRFLKNFLIFGTIATTILFLILNGLIFFMKWENQEEFIQLPLIAGLVYGLLCAWMLNDAKPIK